MTLGIHNAIRVHGGGIFAYEFDLGTFEVFAAVDEPLDHADDDDDEEGDDAVICGEGAEGSVDLLCALVTARGRKDLRMGMGWELTHVATGNREVGWEKEEDGCDDDVGDTELWYGISDEIY